MQASASHLYIEHQECGRHEPAVKVVGEERRKAGVTALRADRPSTGSALQARRRRKLRRRRVTLLVLALLIILTGVILIAPGVGLSMSRTQVPPVHTYVVAPNETLWEIAAQYSHGRDIRDVVYLITQSNRLQTGTIYPGQVLVIPQSVLR